MLGGEPLREVARHGVAEPAIDRAPAPRRRTAAGPSGNGCGSGIRRAGRSGSGRRRPARSARAGARSRVGLGCRREQRLRVRVGGGRCTASSAGPISMILPRYITATVSEMWRTTDRSWAMNRYDSPSRSWRSCSRFITPAWIDTSSADTGSSSTISFGFEGQRPGDADALALAAGELVREALGVVGRQTDQFEQLGDPVSVIAWTLWICSGSLIAHCRPSGAGRATRTGPGRPSASRWRSGCSSLAAHPDELDAVVLHRTRRSARATAARNGRPSTCRSRSRRRGPVSAPAAIEKETPDTAWTTASGHECPLTGGRGIP